MQVIRRAHTLVSMHTQLWQKTFWEVWEPLPLEEKLYWIAFVSQTIGIITMLEIAFLL